MKTLTILFILTSHSSIGDTGKPTGVWLEELSTPYYAFVDAGYDVKIASIKGGNSPVDPASRKAIGENPATVDRFLQDDIAIAKLTNTISVDSIASASEYAAVFLPGGHGTMWDLPESQKLASLISGAYQSGKVVAAVCHGPAGLVNAVDENGKPIVAGKKVSAFTNDEEEASGLTAVVPFLLETRLRDLGAVFEKSANFEPHAVADGNLVTGQNPASSAKVAQLVIERLQN